MAFSVDYSGRGLYTLYIKNLLTGEQLPDSFPVGNNFFWANDSKNLLYDTKDPITLRNDKIWRHVLGTEFKKDVLMYHEKDDTQYAYLEKSASETYFFVQSGYTETVEVHFLDANNPNDNFTKVHPRTSGLFYTIEHWKDKFLIRTNKDAPNFRMMETPVSQPGLTYWTDLIPHREDVLIESFAVFEQHLVTTERKNGLNQLHVTRMDDQSDHYIQTGEPTYSCAIDNNPEFKTQTLRYSFTSPKTPTTIIDYDMETRQGTIKKVAPVLGGYDPSLYETAFVWAPARDGSAVPISLIYKKGLTRDGSAPCFLTGYGSYGYSYDPYFNRDKVSLLNRGFVVGIAHIRGGMEMGYTWYEQGKMLQKINTFTDFIDCSEFLIREGYTAPDRLFAEGRSAGGLLMGAIANMRPDLYKGILTGVPFVDVITTMSDPSIPLTTGEYSEWGNPANLDVFAYMKSYSPYDNLRANNYPHMLVTTSFADSQVQYFEPAKYVARLRDLKTDKNILLFKTNMTGSHGGSSGRFKRLEERALEYAWMLGMLGINEP
jgi:oligopeptidase B